MSLIPMMKLRLLSPELIVDIGRIEGLDQISDDGDTITIGALVRHDETAKSDLVPTALRTAAGWTGDRQVRSRGTTCGAVAHADISADQPSAVLALGATMIAEGPNGTREIAAEDCFVDVLTSALEPDEILTGIRISKNGGVSAYEKWSHRLRRGRGVGSRVHVGRTHRLCESRAHRCRHETESGTRRHGGARGERRLRGVGG